MAHADRRGRFFMEKEPNRIRPYQNEKEFLNDLQSVLERDYDVTLAGVALSEAGANINQFLRSFLS